MKTAWHAASTGLVTCTEWDDWLASDAQVDPYLVWADLTNFASFGGWRSDDDKLHGGKLPILVEVKRETLAKEIQRAPGLSAEQFPPGAIDACPLALGLMDISGAYTQLDVNDARKLTARHFVARIAPANVPTLLLCREDVVRFQLGIPRLPESDPTPRTIVGVTPNVQRGVVVGVIDDGCAFANPNFCSPGGVPRVRYLWDQDHARIPTPSEPKSGGPVGSPGGWKLPLGFKYGAELSYVELKAAVAQRADGDELAPYRSIDYVPIRAEPHVNATQTGGVVPAGTMRRGTHGTSVMDLAVGGHPPLAQQNATEAATTWPARDSAQAWPVVFVQLPTRTVLDTSGGSLGVHVLDGIRYIIDRAVRIAPATDDRADGGPLGEPSDLELNAGATAFWPNRVVINVSYGAIAGPHDGTSILECAMAEIARGQRPPCWIVVAAGNAHQSRSHARLRLQRGGGVAGQFTWRVGPDNPLESYLEVWLPAKDDLGFKLSDDAARAFLLTVYPPGGASPRTVRCGDAAVLRRDASEGGQPLAGIVYARKVAQGNHGTMILLALRRTAAPLAGSVDGGGDTVAAPHGDWQVSVSWAPTEPAQPRHAIVHAWVERNDLLFGNLRRQQSTIDDDQPVPDPTEFTPEVRDFCERRARWVTDQVPRPFQPDSSLGTLAGVAPTRKNFWSNDGAEPDKKTGVVPVLGATVVVGAYRLADGEMAVYSSGGPGRGTAADSSLHPGGLCHPAAMEGVDATNQRVAPDIDAPGDIGVALRGLRTTGLLPGSSARISGTSAAAPTVTRMIANEQYDEVAKTNFAIESKVHQSEEAAVSSTPSATRAWRATPTPTKDDWFRRGRGRVRG